MSWTARIIYFFVIMVIYGVFVTAELCFPKGSSCPETILDWILLILGGGIAAVLAEGVYEYFVSPKLEQIEKSFLPENSFWKMLLVAAILACLTAIIFIAATRLLV